MQTSSSPRRASRNSPHAPREVFLDALELPEAALHFLENVGEAQRKDAAQVA